MRFQFLRDPLFLGAVALFLLNIFVLKKHFAGIPLIHSYLTDILCLPVWIPFMVWGLRRLKLRGDSPPRWSEILASLVFWSLMFEVILPRTTILGRFASGDPLDVAAYALGGVLGFTFWKVWYCAPRALKLRA